MPHIISDRVKERVQSPAGTGTLSLLNTVSGYRRFSSVMSSGDTCYYCLESPSNGDWECGLGTYSSNNALSRTTVYSSSNSGAIVNFANRVSYAFISYVASRAIYLDPSGELNLALSALNDVSLTAPSSGQILSFTGSGWVNGPVPGSYSNEEAQDAVGGILTDTSSISFSYNDGTPSISASVKNSGVTNDMLATGIDTAKIGNGAVSLAEFGYLDGVTSSLQTQLDSKYASANPSGFISAASVASAYQPLDADLTSLASASGSGIYERSGGSWTPVVIGTGLSLGSGILSNTLDLSGYLTSSVATATYLPLAGGTLTGDLKFTDATYDIGKSGATRPRDGWFSRKLNVGSGVSLVDNSASAYGYAVLFDGTNSGIENAQGVGLGLILRGNTVTLMSAKIQPLYYSSQDLQLGATDGSCFVAGNTGAGARNWSFSTGGFHVVNNYYTQTSPALLAVYETYTSLTSFGRFQVKANTGAAYQIGSAIGSAGGTNRDLNFGYWDSAGTFASSFYVGSTYAGINDSKIFYVGTSSRVEFSALSTLAAPAIRFAWGGGSPANIYGGSNTLGVGINGFTRLLFSVSSTDFTGSPFTIANTAVATGAYTGFTFTGAAHTNQTASTEATMVNWNLAQTVQFATGAITTQRAMRIQAPTYSFVGASTITTASTLAISGPPVAGTNATITNAYALNVESGASIFGGLTSVAYPNSGTTLGGSSGMPSQGIALINTVGGTAGNPFGILFGGTTGYHHSAIFGIQGYDVNNRSGDLVFATRPSSSDSSLTEALRIVFNGYLEVGRPQSSLKGGHVVNTRTVASTTNVGTSGSLTVQGEGGVAQHAGAAICLAGPYSGTTWTTACGIKAAKTTATDGDYGFDMTFHTRVNGGSSTEKMRIFSDGSLTFINNTLDIRNSTTAQSLGVYGTYTSSTSYERLNVRGKASANFEFGPENGSAGGTLRGLTIGGYPAGTATIVGWAQFRPNTSTGALEAFYLGPIADSTTTGGNARGTYAIDLQTLRSAATQVAGGLYSVAIGVTNVSSGENTVAIGLGNSAINYDSVAIGKLNGAGYGGVAIGWSNSAPLTGIALGQGNTASADTSVAIGSSNTASGTFSRSTGRYAESSRYGMTSHASGRFAATGDAQSCGFVLSRKTTDATPVNLGLDGSTTRLTIPSGKTMTGFLIVKGIKSDGSAKARFVRLVDITNVGGTTALDTPIEAIGTDYNPSACVLAVTAENATDDLQINITGPAGETWRWVGTFNGLEIAYGT